MKLLILPFFLLALKAQAQDCTQTTLLTASYPLPCNTLTISSSVNLSAVSSAIDIEVTGDVVINANIILSGASGLSLTNDGPGAPGGPAASPGGGRDFGEAIENPDCPPYGPVGDLCPWAGSRGKTDLSYICGDGGSGAGFARVGSNGIICPTSNELPSSGGIAFSYSTIETDLRGGFGGGAGGGIFPGAIAGGGGGGGALRISTQGKFTLSSNASIIANGGSGAASNDAGGAGGGGSGGVIILEATAFDIQGTLSAEGGAGGRASAGGHGGRGSPGLIRLKDPQGVKDFIGIKLPPKPMELNSSISCGTIAQNNEESSQSSFLFQILFPMLVCVGLTRLRKRAQHRA